MIENCTGFTLDTLGQFFFQYFSVSNLRSKKELFQVAGVNGKLPAFLYVPEPILFLILVFFVSIWPKERVKLKIAVKFE